uniref:Uncharacterized protein n=1 Tax=Eutreptiella gymnastica TaxID=73025 RepID=A0A7S4CI71_9EUGL
MRDGWHGPCSVSRSVCSGNAARRERAALPEAWTSAVPGTVCMAGTLGTGAKGGSRKIGAAAFLPRRRAGQQGDQQGCVGILIKGLVQGVRLKGVDDLCLLPRDVAYRTVVSPPSLTAVLCPPQPLKGSSQGHVYYQKG